MAFRKSSAVAAAFFCAAAAAQQQPPVPSISAEQRQALNRAEAGLESPHEAQSIVESILKEDGQLRPILNAMNPQIWYEKRGAPSTYVIQWQSAQREVDDLSAATQLFSQNTENLTSALDLYFRMEALETTARAVNEGAQRYGDASAAGKLQQFVANNFDTRQRFREYIRELAVNLQTNFKIADQQAQQCLAAQSKQTPCPPVRKSKRS